MGEYIEFNRIKFPMELYERLINIFKESLSHTSLTCENAFTELNEKERELSKLYRVGNGSTLNELPSEERDKIFFMMRFFLVYEAASQAMIPNGGELRRLNPNDSESKKRILEVYQEYLSMYDNLLNDVIVFDESGNFNERESYRSVRDLFRLFSERTVLYEKAHSMKKDHLDGFDYALQVPHIGIKEIKEINRIINQSQPEMEEGFKRVNNVVLGSQFDTASKEETAVRMAELIYKYQQNYDIGEQIVITEDSTREEKNLWLYQVMLREARFHIGFVRIHPFADGNGRTARIILNRNLIEQGVAPILITDEMFDDYKRSIAECDYDGLAKSLMILSSQQQSLWVAELRNYLNMSRDSIEPISLEKSQSTKKS